MVLCFSYHTYLFRPTFWDWIRFYNIYLIAFNASLFYFNLCLFLLLFFSLSSIPNENGNLSGPMKQISIFTAKQKKISKMNEANKKDEHRS